MKLDFSWCKTPEDVDRVFAASKSEIAVHKSLVKQALDLWSQPTARRSDPKTSHAAAHSMREPAKLQRTKILLALQAYGPMTADQMDETLGWRPTTAGRRCKELVRAGKIRVETLYGIPATGRTRSGRRAQVYQIVG